MEEVGTARSQARASQASHLCPRLGGCWHHDTRERVYFQKAFFVFLTNVFSMVDKTEPACVSGDMRNFRQYQTSSSADKPGTLFLESGVFRERPRVLLAWVPEAQSPWDAGRGLPECRTPGFWPRLNLCKRWAEPSERAWRCAFPSMHSCQSGQCIFRAAWPSPHPLLAAWSWVPLAASSPDAQRAPCRVLLRPLWLPICVSFQPTPPLPRSRLPSCWAFPSELGLGRGPLFLLVQWKRLTVG